MMIKKINGTIGTGTFFLYWLYLSFRPVKNESSSVTTYPI